MKYLSITHKLLFLTFAMACIAVGLMIIQMSELRDSTYAGREEMLIAGVESAVSVLENMHAAYETGALTEDEARARALEAISAMRYGTDGYFFGISSTGTFLLHPNTALIGTNQSNLTDKVGNLFVQDMLEKARLGGGITMYQWSKPGSPEGELFDKLSYALEFAPWQIVIGTGAYVDDIEASLGRQAAHVYRVGGGAVVLMMALAIGLSLTITRPLARVRSALDGLAQDDTQMHIPFTTHRNEVGRMARSASILKEKVEERQALERRQAEAQDALEAERNDAQARQEQDMERQKHVLATVAGTLDRLAKGDLTARCADLGAQDEALRNSLNAAIEQLDHAMSLVSGQSRDIGQAKDEIRQASNEMSQRTEKDAAGLEETSAALAQLSEAVRQTSESAQNAANRVSTVTQETEASDKIVTDAVEAMDAIEQSASQIRNIIAVIEDIAFQTNLLALNAGVEAARAGERGKGFAVVAQEVRDLAQRSSSAARDVKEQIDRSSAEVDGGVKLVGETGAALKRIFVEIQAADQIVSKIAQSALEQNDTLKALTVAVDELDSSTQQNAAMAEQTTAATESLSHGTDLLLEQINKFQVSGGGSHMANTFEQIDDDLRFAS